MNIAIERTGGLLSEVNCYRALGKLPALQELAIRFILQPEPRYAVGPKGPEGMIQLAKSAIDRLLAGAILGVTCGIDRDTKLAIHTLFGRALFLSPFAPLVARDWDCFYFPGARVAGVKNDNGNSKARCRIMEKRRDETLPVQMTDECPREWGIIWPPEEQPGQEKPAWWDNWKSLHLQLTPSDPDPWGAFPTWEAAWEALMKRDYDIWAASMANAGPLPGGAAW